MKAIKVKTVTQTSAVDPTLYGLHSKLHHMVQERSINKVRDTLRSTGGIYAESSDGAIESFLCTMDEHMCMVGKLHQQIERLLNDINKF